MAGGLDHLGERRQVLWDLAVALRLAKRPPELPLHNPDEQVTPSPMDENTLLQTAFAATGVSITNHLSRLRQDSFTKAGARSIKELTQLKNGQSVKIGGVVVSHKRPGSADGVAFLALEDPDGMVNVTVPANVQKDCAEAMRRVFVMVEGSVRLDRGSANIVARKVYAV
jgi:error-prone DNA polymerase